VAPAPAGDGGCLDDPIGRSHRPDTCSLDLPTMSDCDTAAPSFDRDIAPIVANRCRLCHAPNRIAARVQFDTYPLAYSWYKLMYTQVYSCQMPPSCAGPMPEEERQVLLKWFVCKAPPGPIESPDAAAGDAIDEASPADAEIGGGS
jgi:hypothetical protein